MNPPSAASGQTPDNWEIPRDPLGAFCRENHIALKGSSRGRLTNLSFAAKDVFHIEGARTGFGQPDWLATHSPATETARAVQQLLDAGATLSGKTHTDELAYSLTGENVHYGTPINPTITTPIISTGVSISEAISVLYPFPTAR